MRNFHCHFHPIKKTLVLSNSICKDRFTRERNGKPAVIHPHLWYQVIFLHSPLLLMELSLLEKEYLVPKSIPQLDIRINFIK